MYTANIVWTTSTAMVEIPIPATLPVPDGLPPPSLCRMVAVPDAAPQPLLRPLQRRVLRGLAGGLTLREVAAELRYSYPYVRELAASAASQLGAKNSVQAVAIAARRGLI